MKITVFGAGYVGLVTATCLAEVGNHVLCVDVDELKIERLRNGECPIHEPGLPEMMTQNIDAGRLSFTTDSKEAVNHGFIQFIAVGTPSDEDGSADMQYVLTVADTIGKHINEHKIIVTKSTVPVGTSDKVKKQIDAGLKTRKQNINFDICSNPEFLREGAAIKDFMNSDRIIIGVDNPEAEEHLRVLYTPFDKNKDRLIAMDIRSAELTKYAANAMLAAKISFINELSNIAELVGADIEKIRVGIGSDPRIGYHFINPGCGYGGSCFPKDVSALQKIADENNYNAELIKSIKSVNKRQKMVLFNKIKTHFKDNLKGKVIAVWGLSFKPNTDDMRDASSRVLIEALWDAGARVQAYDPVAMKEAERIYKKRDDFALCPSAEQALEGADALAIVTEWSTFLSPDFNLIKQYLSEPVIFDGRNLYDPNYLAKLGFTYYSIGRSSSGRGQ